MRKRMMGWTIGLMLIAGSTSLQAAPPSAAQVRQLFDVIHLDRMMVQMSSQMAAIMGQELPCVPASFWSGFINAGNENDLFNRMVPIYQHQFDAQDIDGLLKFYRSPLGQKVITKMPLTMAEGMKIGEQWGRERGTQMVGELEQKGVIDANGRCPAAPAAAHPAGRLGQIPPPPPAPGSGS